MKHSLKNVVQAVARDVLMEGIPRLEDNGISVLTSPHD